MYNYMCDFQTQNNKKFHLFEQLFFGQFMVHQRYIRKWGY